MRKTIHGAILPAIAASLTLASCVGESAVEENAKKYADWKEQNERYVAEQEARLDENGDPYYTRIEPAWAPAAYTLMRWHNDRSLTQGRLQPLDNSTVEITYELFDIEGKRIQDSFSNTDSVYSSQPLNNVVGIWVPLTNMHVGDSVTIVIPSQAGYGGVANGDILPYSTLIYNVKLKSISKYQIR